MPRTYAKLQYFAYLAKTSKFKRSFFSKLASVLTILLQLKHHFQSMAISSHSLSSKMVISNHLLRISDLRRTFLSKRNLQLAEIEIGFGVNYFRELERLCAR